MRQVRQSHYQSNTRRRLSHNDIQKEKQMFEPDEYKRLLTTRPALRAVPDDDIELVDQVRGFDGRAESSLPPYRLHHQHDHRLPVVSESLQS